MAGRGMCKAHQHQMSAHESQHKRYRNNDCYSVNRVIRLIRAIKLAESKQNISLADRMRELIKKTYPMAIINRAKANFSILPEKI